MSFASFQICRIFSATWSRWHPLTSVWPRSTSVVCWRLWRLPGNYPVTRSDVLAGRTRCCAWLRTGRSSALAGASFDPELRGARTALGGGDLKIVKSRGGRFTRDGCKKSSVAIAIDDIEEFRPPERKPRSHIELPSCPVYLFSLDLSPNRFNQYEYFWCGYV